MMRRKITIVGAGNVGATAAHWALIKELGDIVLIDIAEGIPQGKALDLFEAAPVVGLDCRIIGTCDYEMTKDSDMVIITAGLARKPGMSRDDLLIENAKIVKSVTEKIIQWSPNAFIIVVSNPLDVMTYLVREVSGFQKQKVIGMAGVLDASRFRAFVGDALGVSVEDIQTMVLGGHGDSMVPLPRYSTISGIPITEFMSEHEIEKIVERTRKAGGEIVSYLKTGSAYYSPSASAIQMVEAIIKDKKRVLPCSACLEGEYGVSDGLYVGVPVKLGSKGVEEIIEIKLNEKEWSAFKESVEEVRGLVEKLRNEGLLS